MSAYQEHDKNILGKIYDFMCKDEGKSVKAVMVGAMPTCPQEETLLTNLKLNNYE